VFPGLLAADRRLLGVASSAHWADLGTPRRYLDGHRAVVDGRCDWPTPLHLGPHAVAIHPTAQVARGAQLGPHAVVGARAVVADGARICDSVLLDGAEVGAQATVTGAVLGFAARVEAGATATPGTVLGDGAVLA
jgi:mannose-1-phosphate guanylyltransferase